MTQTQITPFTIRAKKLMALGISGLRVTPEYLAWKESQRLSKQAFPKRLRTLGYKVISISIRSKKTVVVYVEQMDDAESAE